MQLHQLDLPQSFDSEIHSSMTFASEHFIQHLMGAAKVYVQYFRGLPLRVRVRDERGEHVSELPERFKKAAQKMERVLGTNINRDGMWSFYGYRHGSLEEAAEVVVAELDMTIDDSAIDEWCEGAAQDREISLLHPIYSVAMLTSPVQEEYLA